VINFTIVGNGVQLGTNLQKVDMGIMNASIYLGYTDMLFSANFTYFSLVPDLPVYVSLEKCSLFA
jgi:hypothetical protein